MISLILAILCSASIALLFKISENDKHNRYIVTSANYFAAFTVSLWLYIDPFNKLASGGLLGRSQIPFGPLLLLGIPAGLFFFLSFIFYQMSVKENGASLSAMFGKLGILLPMLISIIVWHELPSLLQGVGICLALISIVVVSYSPKVGRDLKNNGLNTLLILLFIAGGLAEFSNKVFQKMSLPHEKNLFLFIVFFTAFIMSLLFIGLKKGNKSQHLGSDLLLGLLVGIPNLLSSFFLINALNDYPASLVFPIYSSGSIVMVMLLSFLLFKEHLSRKSLVSIALTLIALLLIS